MATFQTSIAIRDVMNNLSRDESVVYDHQMVVNDAFEEVHQRGELAIRMATGEAQSDLNEMGLGGSSVKIKSIEFMECDSGNWSHACAHYEVTVVGVSQAKLDEALDKLYA